MRILVALVVLSWTGGPAQAADGVTGNDLLQNCGFAVRQADGEKLGELEMIGATYCAGYLAGFTDSHAVEAMAKPRRQLYCLPSGGVENGQLSRIVVKYMRDNPEVLHMSARILIASAVTKAFPCGKK